MTQKDSYILVASFLVLAGFFAADIWQRRNKIPLAPAPDNSYLPSFEPDPIFSANIPRPCSTKEFSIKNGVYSDIIRHIEIKMEKDEQAKCDSDVVGISTKDEYPYHSAFAIWLTPTISPELMAAVSLRLTKLRQLHNATGGFRVIDGTKMVGNREIAYGHTRDSFENFYEDIYYYYLEKGQLVEISSIGYPLEEILKRITFKN